MASETSSTCPSCGARIPAGADRCELCGTAIDDSASADAPDDENAPPEGDSASPEPESEGASVYCNDCGWENPPAAKFCSQCGERLQAVEGTPGTRPVAVDLPSAPAGEESSSADPPASDEQAVMGQRIMLMVGGALVLVVGLFFVTQWSQQYQWGDPGSETEAPSAQSAASGQGEGGGGPVGGGMAARQQSQGGASGSLTDLGTLVRQQTDSVGSAMAGQVDSLRSRVRSAQGDSKQQLRAQLVNLLIGAGQPGRAALQQTRLAEASGATDDRRRAADLLYKWMRKLQGEGNRQSVVEVARHVAEAYGAVVDARPDDLDARTRMGEAYLLTNKPMEGIRAINSVIKDDSTFVPARFQKGLALLQIGRIQQALSEFRAVRGNAEQGSPFFRQAGQAIDAIQKRMNESQAGSGSAPGTPSQSPES